MILFLWLYLGGIITLGVGALIVLLWSEREPRRAPAPRQQRRRPPLPPPYEPDESLISYVGESRRKRLRRVQPGQHVRGVWARIR